MDIKDNLAKNIIIHRKHLGLTQTQLAEKLNYSDKAVSKWERGEGVPDIFVLKQLADLFETSIDSLLKTPPKEKPKNLHNLNKKRLIIGLLSAGLVWLIAILIFSFMNIIYPPLNGKAWLAFIIAVPITFIVLLSLTSVWGKNIFNAIFTSCLIWTTILTVYLCLNSFLSNKPPFLWMIFLIGIPLQALTILFFSYKKVK